MFASAEHYGEEVAVTSRWHFDPLEDHAVSVPLLIDEAAVLRLVLVASEAGARFQREASGDAFGWMIEPCAAFSGQAPIEACMSREECVRAVLIHGLGLDPDINRAALDNLAVREDVS